MNFDPKDLQPKQLIDIYKQLLKPRLIEEKMLILLRQGEVSKWFSGIGQEAISVGAVAALEFDEYILPLHRNLGIFTGRNIPLKKLFAQFQGKKSGFTKGRDRSFHFGTHEHHIVGMISHLGPQLAVADGIALASKLNAEDKVTLVFSGDGGSSEGDFHEALNVAAVWQLPVIFLVENNGYGLSTPNHEQFRFDSFTQKGPGYGMKTMQVDGNNVLEVYHAINSIAKNIREKPEPYLVEAMTFRMRGHEEASGIKYVPAELLNHWAEKDPVTQYEIWLIQENILTADKMESIKTELKSETELAWNELKKEEYAAADTKEELADVFSAYNYSEILPANHHKTEKRFVDAISSALWQSMERYDNLILMGQDIADYGGVFKITDGFVAKFGKDRVRNTPLCESAILGAALGLSIKGYKSMVEMQFADFVSSGFNQIVNNLAKSYYRWQQPADVVIRMPCGAGVGAGPYHSQTNESWFFTIPGLKIFYPSTPYDAKGLLNTAIEDPNPVLFFEHKYLYRSVSEPIPDEYYTIEAGKARYIKQGSDITIITFGLCVSMASQLLEELEISADLIDLRTLVPLDKETIEQSVRKTGKVLIVNEDNLTGSVSAEIAAWIGENLFEYLDAPVFRVGSLDTPIPFAKNLENNFLPRERLKKRIKDLVDY